MVKKSQKKMSKKKWKKKKVKKKMSKKKCKKKKSKKKMVKKRIFFNFVLTSAKKSKYIEAIYIFASEWSLYVISENGLIKL